MSALWWQTGVVYQVYPRSFRDTNGDGVGDLAGITSRLDYLADTLGVDAVWLSPFYPSPMEDFGYDVADYTDVDPLFGDLADFDSLLEGCHARGLRLIVDLVPNHTSDRHPWFLESRSARISAKRDWYTWMDPKPDGSPPNNWQAVFGGPAWEWDEATGQFYLHSFLPSQPDLNWRNPAVREAVYAAMRFWLDRGVDGFRIDVAHYLMKDPEFRDNPVAAAGDGPDFKDLRDYDAFEHTHDKGHPDVHGVFREMRALLDGYTPPRMAVGEIHVFDFDEWATYYGDGDELHMPFNFSLLYANWTAEGFRRRIDGLEASLPPGAWPNYVLGNHDESRIATRFGGARSRVAAVLLLTLRGTPTLYYGDELGLPEVEIPPELQQDPWGLRVPGLGRDGCRTPMPWDGGANGGFCAAGVAPWLPLGPAAAEHNVAAEIEAPRSHLSLYRALLALRRASSALREGIYRPLDGVPEACFAYRREHPGARSFTVALNFSADPIEVPGLGPGTISVSTGMDRTGEVVGGTLALGPDEGVVIAPG
jgi:glycosidase